MTCGRISLFGSHLGQKYISIPKEPLSQEDNWVLFVFNNIFIIPRFSVYFDISPSALPIFTLTCNPPDFEFSFFIVFHLFVSSSNQVHLYCLLILGSGTSPALW